MEEGETKAVLFVMVILLMTGSVMMYFIGSGILANVDDPYVVGHDYTFTGTLDVKECTGEGRTEYSPETTNGHLYTMHIRISSSDDTRDFKIGIMFGPDDRPVSDLYSYEGESVIDGQVLKGWRHIEKNMDYTMFTAEKCKVGRIVLMTGDVDITGDIVQVIQ